MNSIIIVCGIVISVVLLFLIFSRSQTLQRFGVMELLLLLVVGAGLWLSDRDIKQLEKEHVKEIYAKDMERVLPYLGNLEDELSEDTVQTQAAEILDDIIQVGSEDTGDCYYLNAVIVEKDGENKYHCYKNKGDNELFWDEVSKEAVNLIYSAVKNQKAVCGDSQGEIDLAAVTAPGAIVPKYALITEFPMDYKGKELAAQRQQMLNRAILFLLTGSIMIAAVVILQGRQMREVIRLMTRVATGKEDFTAIKKEKKTFWLESNEMRTIYNSLNQISSDVQRMNYMKYQMLRAYYRFAPKQIEKILDKQSILDVGIADRIHTQGTLAFVSFSIQEKLGEQEYLQQMNRNAEVMGEIQEHYDGIILSGNSDISTIEMLFREETKKAVQFGIEMLTRDSGEKKSKAFVLLHTTSMTYGVAGNDAQAFTYVLSREMKVLEKYVDDLRGMGILMAVTDSTYDRVKKEVSCRYIGFIEDDSYSFKLYEVLDAYPVNERQKRAAMLEVFQKALNLFYQDDFYLARSQFMEVLKECPSDEVAKWYVFLCEKCLDSRQGEKTSLAILTKQQ